MLILLVAVNTKFDLDVCHKARQSSYLISPDRFGAFGKGMQLVLGVSNVFPSVVQGESTLTGLQCYRSVALSTVNNESLMSFIGSTSQIHKHNG